MDKAKFIGRSPKKEKKPYLVYEYKGYKYEVFPNDYKSMAIQHQIEQNKINEYIRKKKNQELAESEPAELGFQSFWEYLEGGKD